MTTPTDPPKSKRGFASMTPERRRELAAKGGAALKPHQRTFSKNRDLASRAGTIGGERSAKSRWGQDGDK